ncbi:MAG TPA: J domain-containing protein [Bradyrhizobium sp.]|nr:J domain-containing protein [Bradyrhizobium sp.]
MRCPIMEMQQKQWKRDTDRLWSASPFDVRQAAALAAEIARHGADETLRQTATQALPSLRGACLKTSDQMSRNLARRRFGAIRDALHALDAPRFGKRAAVPAPEQLHRRLLGLPPERQLSDPEIQQGYKRAAKRLHPDAGGSAREFTELSAARDALMKRK